MLTWAAAWGVYLALRAAEAPLAVALGLPALLGAVLAVWGATPWRRVFIALGFPLSLLGSGLLGASVPAWVWLLPLAVLLALYPVHAWRDAPVFPTPRGALKGLDALVPLPADARIADAGCGLGDGLRELRACYPQAQIEGWEWSWPLTLLCRVRAALSGWRVTVRRADIWNADWSQHDLVYLFQRPESMPRALEKARAEMKPGAWLASLEFEASDLKPQAVHHCLDERPVWLYRAPFSGREDSGREAGSKTRRKRS